MDPLDPAEPDRNQTDPAPESADLHEDTDQLPADDTDEAQMLCPHCLAVNPPLADFCHKCGGPISSLATMDPYKNIFAQGWAYRRAVANPTKPIILWGMLLIFGIPVLTFCISTLLELVEMHRSPSLFSTDHRINFGALLPIGILILYAAICWRVIRRYHYLNRLQPSQCTICGYGLRGLPEPRCPECGHPFRPKDEDELEDSDLEDEESSRPEEPDA